MFFKNRVKKYLPVRLVIIAAEDIIYKEKDFRSKHNTNYSFTKKVLQLFSFTDTIRSNVFFRISKMLIMCSNHT